MIAEKAKAEGREIKLCIETNASLKWRLLLFLLLGLTVNSLLSKVAQLSLESGGCIKVDLKVTCLKHNFNFTRLGTVQLMKRFVELTTL